VAKNVPDLFTLLYRAIDRGEASFTIPPGTYDLDRPFFIPGGRDGLTIYANGVTFKHRRGYTGVLLAHASTLRTYAGNNANLPGWASRIAAAALSDRNAGTLALDASSSVTAGYHILTDDTQSVGTQGTYHVKRELVYISTSGTVSSVAFGRQPARVVGTGSGQGSTYSAAAELVPVQALSSRNITIEGLTLDGSAAPTGYADYLSHLAFVDGLTFRNCMAKNFKFEGLTTMFCRNCLYDGCALQNSNGSAGGQGYAIAEYGVYNTRSLNCTFTDTGSATQGIRHAHYTAYGASNKLQSGCRASNTYNPASKDTPLWEVGSHVGPDRDCKMVDCRHSSGVGGGIGAGGHQLFGYGSTAPLIENCHANGHDLFIALDTTDPVYTDVTGVRRVWLIGCKDRSAAGAVPSAPAGPQNIKFIRLSAEYVLTSAAFDNNGGAAGTYGAHRWQGYVEFDSCTIVNPATDAPAINMETDGAATWRIKGGGAFRTAAAVHRVIDLNGNGGSITIDQIQGATFQLTDPTNEREAFRLQGAGSVAGVSGNTFVRNGTPSFMLDASGNWTGEGDGDTSMQ
jgi:hypothetical protein